MTEQPWLDPTDPRIVVPADFPEDMPEPVRESYRQLYRIGYTIGKVEAQTHWLRLVTSMRSVVTALLLGWSLHAVLIAWGGVKWNVPSIIAGLLVNALIVLSIVRKRRR